VTKSSLFVFADTEKPTFPGCESLDPFYVKKYNQVPFSTPMVEDNSGAVSSLVLDAGLSLTERILSDQTFTWRATDHAGNEETCDYDVRLAGMCPLKKKKCSALVY